MADDTPSNDNSKPDIYKLADDDGRFKRKDSQFRDWVSTEPDTKFLAEKGRYVLYLNRGCPWAHRANIVHKLKGLEDVIQIVTMGYNLTPDGWIYDGPTSDPCDPIYGFTKHKQLYYKADPNYTGRFTVPVLWDRKHETIVNNESSDIIRMFYTAFDAFIPPHLRETAKPLFPLDKQPQITSMNDWIYPTINNGVYKCGFATTQAAYDESIHPLFASLDRLESHLATTQTPFLFGPHITDADIRLYPTIARFDVAYHTLFKCNLKMIRHDYPFLHRWLQRLYWDRGPETNGGAFASTMDFGAVKKGYTFVLKGGVVPAGPEPPILPL